MTTRNRFDFSDTDFNAGMNFIVGMQKNEWCVLRDESHGLGRFERPSAGRGLQLLR